MATTRQSHSQERAQGSRPPGPRRTAAASGRLPAPHPRTAPRPLAATASGRPAPLHPGPSPTPPRSSPANFPHTAPTSHKQSLPGPPQPQPTSVRPPHNSDSQHKGASHSTDPRFYSRAPPRQNPRKLKGETAGEGKQREEANGGGWKQSDGPEAI